uniref:Glycosyltransferase n=1 Tax=Centella asiatica TaxID=48106 RepID=A0A172CP19_CENAS|nr:UDP-glucosyltransferase [Centella asiatica]
MASNIQQLHFVLVPLMSQSHIIPLTDFGKLLAQRGVVVTMITTPLNAVRCKPIIDGAQNANLNIQLASLHFPTREVGLPEGVENLDELSMKSLKTLGINFFQANEMLREPLEKLLAEMVPRPSCIISTDALPWTNEVAWKFKIPRYSFNTISCFSLVLFHKLKISRVHESVTSDSESFVVPGLPDKIELKRSQLPEWVKRTSNDNNSHVMDKLKATEHLPRGVLVNTFEEMEPRYVEEFKKQEKLVFCVGSVSLCNTDQSDMSSRGNKASVEEDSCLKWLDSMKPCSVIYVCFGSLSNIPYPQLIELGLGLEASNRPFIWIIRKGDYSPRLEKWLEEYRFEEKVKGRGLIIRGWAPQVLILSHPSVGGFFTHCGWNSILEAVCEGMPMITWPMFAEQFYNERFVVDVVKIGVPVGVEEALTSVEDEEKFELLVTSSQVKEAIDELMDGEDAGERRKRARELGEKAKKAIEDGGSSYLYITNLIEDVRQQNSSRF